MKRLDQITFTRFTAVLLVLITHGVGKFYFSFADSLGIFPVIYNLAPIGVASLYMLSGFVLSIAYFQPGQPFDVSAYLRARIIRVYPLYFLAFMLICYYYRDALLTIKPQKILTSIFILQAWIPSYSQSFNYPSWSVSVEVFFYALFPFFAIWAYRQSTKKIITVTLLFWAVTQFIYHFLWMFFLEENRNFVMYFPLFHVSSFMLGSSAGIWYKQEGINLIIKPAVIKFILLASILFIVGYTVIATFYVPSLPSGFQPLAGLLVPFSTLIILSLALDKSNVSKNLNRPVFVALGEGAYALYIFHIPLAWNIEVFLQSLAIQNSHIIFNVVFLPTIIISSVAMHYLFDVPFRKWLKQVLERVNLPLLFLDLIILTASVYYSFRLRFEIPREYESYFEIGRLIFYSAFFIRPILSILFKTLSRETITLPFNKLLRSLFISTTIGSALVAVIAYLGFNAGLSVNFPRSIFIMDWLIVFSLSLLVRFLFRLYWLNEPIPNSSEQGMTHV